MFEWFRQDLAYLTKGKEKNNMHYTHYVYNTYMTKTKWLQNWSNR